MEETTTLRTPDELIAAGLVAPDAAVMQERIAARYAVAIPPALAALIDRDDPADPIARQFVPDPAELDVQPHELADPIGDAAHMPVEGIVQSVPVPLPRARTPEASAAFEVEPQLSVILTYWPWSVVVPVVPLKIPAELV